MEPVAHDATIWHNIPQKQFGREDLAVIFRKGDITEIMKYHILSTPALVINEKVVSSGKVLSKER